MYTLANIAFPDCHNKEESKLWVTTIRQFAMASKVLVVAKTRIEGKWKAYVDAVPGQNHDNEQDRVMRQGVPVCEDLARVMFPDWNDIPYAR